MSLKTTPVAALCLLFPVVVWLYFSRVPLAHTDLWAHLAYGGWIESHGLPGDEPLLPLAKGVPFVDTAWLSQWLWYRLHAMGGAAALQQAHALIVAGTGACVITAAWRSTRFPACGFLAGAIWLATGWFQMLVIRPQQAGMLCGAALLLNLADRKTACRRPAWIALLFAIWANLHGSFVIGWLFLAAVLNSRLATVALHALRRRRSAVAALRDDFRAPRPARRLLLGLLLAVAGTLCNPYGVGLYREVLQVASHSNLRDLTEWQPLRLDSRQGRNFLVSLGLLAMVCATVCRLPRRAHRPGDARRRRELDLPTAILAGATFNSARFVVWWSLIAPLAIAQAVAPIARLLAVPHGLATPRRVWTLSAILLSCAAILGSPPMGWLCSGHSPPLAEIVTPRTPLQIAQELHGLRPQRLIFAPLEWGDYLLWAGPPGTRVFAGSHVHLLPSDAWRDYLTVIRRGAGWRDVLRQRGVSLVILERRRWPRLIREFEQDPEWRVVFADRLGVVWIRVETLPRGE